MKHSPPHETPTDLASTVFAGRPTSQIVTIGQVWQRRSRSKHKPEVTVRQVHRRDRQVEVVDDRNKAQLVTFSDLRAKYRLIYNPPQGGQR